MVREKKEVSNEEISLFLKHLKDRTGIGLLAWLQLIEESSAKSDSQIFSVLVSHYELDEEFAEVLMTVRRNLSQHGNALNDG